MVGLDRLRRRGALLCSIAVLVSAGAAVAGCGGGDEGGNDADATSLLDTAFSNGIRSADVKLSAQLRVNGLQGVNGPISLDASGPFIAAKKQLPKLDMDVTVGASGSGQALQTGFLSTGDRAFLKFGGEYYEQPRANVAQANRQLASESGKQNPLGLDPKRWLRGAEMDGEDTIGGVKTDHVTAQVDVRKMLEDLNALARKGTRAVGGTTVPEPLTTKQLDDAVKTVKDPRFDVYVGKDDKVIHRVSGSISLSVPKSDQSSPTGISGGSLRFTLDLADTNGNQKVEAPASSRPISELSSRLGGAAALNGLVGGSGGSGTSTTPGTTTPQNGGAGTSTTPDADAFKRYSQCLDRTSPADSAARARCRSELN